MSGVPRGGCLLQIYGVGGVCSKFSGGRGCLLQIFGGGVCSKFFWGGGEGGVCSKFSGGVSAPNFGGVLQFSEYGQRSAGTHPTGMHSCFKWDGREESVYHFAFGPIFVSGVPCRNTLPLFHYGHFTGF